VHRDEQQPFLHSASVLSLFSITLTGYAHGDSSIRPHAVPAAIPARGGKITVRTDKMRA
jgi:hypothetical protein